MASEERKAYMREYLKGYRAANKQKAAEYATQYYLGNKERLLAYAKDYREENPEAVSERKKRAVRAKPEHYRNLAKRTAERNKEKIAAYFKEYVKEHRKNNRGRYAAYAMKRHAAQMKATPGWADFHAIQKFYDEAARLTAETGTVHHVDHIVPLQSKKVCGLHCQANLQVLTRSENISKNNRHWPDMP